MGREDPMEKGMATHSSNHAWEAHKTRSRVGYSPWGRKASETSEQVNNDSKVTLVFHCESLQYSMLSTRELVSRLMSYLSETD